MQLHVATRGNAILSLVFPSLLIILCCLGLSYSCDEAGQQAASGMNKEILPSMICVMVIMFTCAMTNLMQKDVLSSNAASMDGDEACDDAMCG